MKPSLWILALSLPLSGCLALPSPLASPAGGPCSYPSLSIPVGSSSLAATPPACPVTQAPPAGAVYGRFVRLGSIGCQDGGLAVLRSAADWAAYKTSSSCGVAVAGALDCFDFSQYTVLSLQSLDCGIYCGGSPPPHIVDVAIYPTQVLVIVVDGGPGNPMVCPHFYTQCSITAGVATCVQVPAPTHDLCQTDVVAIPATTLPVGLYVVSSCPLIM